jgi:putative FmdB family regulatory protein
MPSYEHKCKNEECNHEFEDFYSITAPVPVCPTCGSEAQRLISGGSGRGIVELTGQDLKNKVKADVRDMKHRMNTDVNYRANLVGEERYNKNVTSRD